MTLPYLTDDCIYYILQHLQNDRSTLFNCLLVNRFWCKSTIPLLYANPFINMIEKNYSIISTIILCFNRTEILRLKNQLGISQINDIDFDEEDYKPLFEYTKHLENYNYFIINSVICKWFVKYCSDLSISHNKICDDIIPIFHQSILRQSRNIKQLDLLLYLFYNENFKNFQVQNFTSNLTKLNSLSLNFHLIGTNYTKINEIEQEFLSNISNISLNLRKLTIKLPRTNRSLFQYVTSNNLINTSTMEKLCTIIQKQNKLKMFKITNCYTLLNNVLLSLEFQKYSLVQIEFINSDFSNVSLKSLNDFYNLESLTFEICKGLFLDQCEVLNLASFKLKGLTFKRNIWNIDVTSLMVKYLGASLQRLFVDNPTIPLINNISMYCLNLICLKIRINFHIDLSVLPFFKNLRSKILNISISYYYSNNINEFFINLANNIPFDIKKISIHLLNSNNFLRFKEFLDNCHNGFEVIYLNHMIELEFLKIVLNYIERSNNSLKILGIRELDKELNDEELKLLNQIKAKGVRIVDFNTFYNVYYI
ncbi:hypothetical protein RclHR1_01490017 [Rhizophagus clarus]|uniref:F-box domain-containing protein n=1 Tax=Rhizophagus clarus TaxID=94130 RepID=A0A2Z6R6C7_9GLOM|nr:hypothetical protein RclHR1_01490017 [Rhizophagus clarus]GES75621.1 hypothetical protein GLOIN_2v1791592 [Rhizophagus clarus]